MPRGPLYSADNVRDERMHAQTWSPLHDTQHGVGRVSSTRGNLVTGRLVGLWLLVLVAKRFTLVMKTGMALGVIDAFT